MIVFFVNSVLSGFLKFILSAFKCQTKSLNIEFPSYPVRRTAGANTRYHRFEKVIEQPAADNTVFINPDIVQAYDPDRYECWRVLHRGGGWDSPYISVA